MTTLANMTEQILSELNSYVRNQDSLTVITQPIGSTDLTWFVDDVSAVSKGTCEIGEELVYVKKVLPVDGQIQILPGGRGWQATTAASHLVNSIIRNNPTFPRTQIMRAVNDTIKAIDLYVLANFDFSFDGTTMLYTLPEDLVDVVGVTYETKDSSGRWPTLNDFRLQFNHWPTGATAPRAAIELLSVPPAGYTVRVQYLKPASPISSTDDFSATGFPSSCEDMIRLGAMYRLVSTVDPGKLLANSVGADMLDQPVPAGRASDVSKYLYQLFQARLAEEKAKQADNFDTIIHYTG